MNPISLLALISPEAARDSVDVVQKTMPHVELSPAAEQSTYFLARIVMRLVHWILGIFGLGDDQTVVLWVYAIVVLAISWGIGIVFTWIILATVRIVGRHWKADIYHNLTEAKFFSKTCRIVPPIVFLIFIQFTINQSHATLATWLTRITWIYLIFLVVRSLSVLISVVWKQVDARRNTKHLPLKGLVQLIQGVLWILAFIVMVGIIVNKSPASLLAGLGAFAAVLMLVFKDSILGVVAGVQLSENDSVHVGDWIKVDGTNANGTVLEVSLTAVKIQNWDKTVTTLPPYHLVSGSFTNYRPMQLSKTRRIQRSYLIDSDSIVPTDDQMLADYAKIPLLKDWIEKKIAQRAAGHVQDVNNSEGLVNGSIESNLGVFRAYLQLYLNADPNIDKTSDCFISTLEQTPNGVPLQVYCFTSTSAWIPYEAIQSALFEHIAVMLHRFNLYVFELNTGRDTILEGYMSRGDNPATAFGLPYPFYNNQMSDPADPGSPASAQSNPHGTSPAVAAEQPLKKDPDFKTPPSPASDGGPTV